MKRLTISFFISVRNGRKSVFTLVSQASFLRQDLQKTGSLQFGNTPEYLHLKVNYVHKLGLAPAGKQQVIKGSKGITPKMRYCIVRSAKRCRHCILGLLYSASSKLESQNQTQCSMCSVHSIVHSCQVAGVACQILRLQLRSDRIQQAKNITTTSICWSHNSSSLD